MKINSRHCIWSPSIQKSCVFVTDRLPCIMLMLLLLVAGTGSRTCNKFPHCISLCAPILQLSKSLLFFHGTVLMLCSYLLHQLQQCFCFFFKYSVASLTPQNELHYQVTMISLYSCIPCLPVLIKTGI